MCNVDAIKCWEKFNKKLESSKVRYKGSIIKDKIILKATDKRKKQVVIQKELRPFLFKEKDYQKIGQKNRERNMRRRKSTHM